MKRSYSNGKLKFSTLFKQKEICLFEIDIKKPFEYETEEVDGQIIDTVIKNDELDTALHFISNDNHLIALQKIVTDDHEKTFPIIIFDEKRHTPAIQNDTLILITTNHNLSSDYPIIKECINEDEQEFFNRLNICEIYTHPDFNKIQYHNTHSSCIDGSLNYFHFDKNFEEIYVNYRDEDCRVSKWLCNIGQKDEYIITQCDETGETYMRYTHFTEQLKHNFKQHKTLFALGVLAIMTGAIIKCSRSPDTPEPKTIIPAEKTTQDISSLPHTR